jgi:hypothetical protein
MSIKGLAVRAAVALVALAGLAAVAVHPAAAQGGPGVFGNALSVTVCSTTDYTDVVAKALGMDSAELRRAFVSGKTLAEVADSKKIELSKVNDAVNAAYKAEIDQAVKDGLITQEQADVIKKAMDGLQNRPGVVIPFGRGRNDGNRGQRGRIEIIIGGIGFGYRGNMGLSETNVVKPYIAAAKALDMTCPALVKALQQGKSMAVLASDKKLQVQVVIDAITKAYKDALDKDVKEGLITQAQADGRSLRLIERVMNMVSHPGLLDGDLSALLPVPMPFRGGGITIRPPSINLPPIPGLPGAATPAPAPTQVK